MSNISIVRSGDSACSSSSLSSRRHANTRMKKRHGGALLDELALATQTHGGSARNLSSFEEDGAKKKNPKEESKKTSFKGQQDDFMGLSFGCGGKAFDSDSYGFGCGGHWKNADPKDPFGMVGRVQAMLKDKFSSRVDFSSTPDTRPRSINFVEHRM